MFEGRTPPPPPPRPHLRLMSFPYRHKDYVVKMGDTLVLNDTKDTTLATVRDIVVHNSFELTHLRFDIALILLDFSVSYTSSIQPICLPIKSYEVKSGTSCWVTGWGRYRRDGESGSRNEGILEDALIWVKAKGRLGDSFLIDGQEVKESKGLTELC